MQVNLEIFKIHCTLNHSDFSLRLTKAQHHYRWYFWVKFVAKLFFFLKCKKMKPYDFLLIPTYYDSLYFYAITSL